MTERQDYLRPVRIGSGEDRISRKLSAEIELSLVRLGLLARVFGRVKSSASLEEKFDRAPLPYSADGKRLQDLFGVRIALYFADDLEIAQTILKQNYEFDSESISPSSNDSFGPNRCNLVFKLPSDFAAQCIAIKGDRRIDDTFEVQFRTVLSEGWHEVEHDLRYKRKGDWGNHKDLDRSLNGVMATLETCDWTMMQIFSELSWRSFKERNVSAMLNSKFRLRLSGQPITGTSTHRFLLDNEPVLRALFRVDRSALLNRLLRVRGELPLNELNIVLFANRVFQLSSDLHQFEPPPLQQLFEREFADSQ